MAMLNSDLEKLVDEYYNARPQLKRPEKNSLGMYDCPVEWRNIMEHLFNKVNDELPKKENL